MLIDWDALGIPEYEEPSVTMKRLDEIHAEILKAKGLDTKPQKNSPGFVPSAAQAREVAVMACLGLSPKDIALVINVELDVLNMYYKKELKVSHNLANAMVARVALQMALSGRFPDMTRFWLKSQGKWKENHTEQVEDKSKGNGYSAKERLRATLEKPATPLLPKPGS